MQPPTVLVVDYGAQYAQLIARRVREAQVYSEIVPGDTPVAEIVARKPAALILSGGPSSVYEPGAPAIDPELFRNGIPVLGLCYGFQAMAKALGGEVAPDGTREYGRTELTLCGGSALHDGLPQRHPVWMSHGDSVVRAPEGFTVTASSERAAVAAFEDTGAAAGRGAVPPRGRALPARPGGAAPLPARGRRHRARLDHLVDHRRHGRRGARAGRGRPGDLRALRRRRLGGCGRARPARHRRPAHVRVRRPRTAAGRRARAGGAGLRGRHGRELHTVDARDRFLDALAGVSDPEQKRKIIGREFIRVFEAATARGRRASEHVGFLVQGTLYPDVVESGGGSGTATIKSHHNVGGLPDDLEFELVEPLRALFKDEVRRVGAELGLPETIVHRQPFPGPGLGIRIIGEVTADRLATLRAADAIAREELTARGLDRDIWQCPVVLLADVRSVGVQGDGRTYGHPVVLRPVSSEDAMTADWTRLPYDLLERISTRITNEVAEVNRVVLDVTSKPPGTIEWE